MVFDLKNDARPAHPRVVAIIPCFNEETVLPLLRDRLAPVLAAVAEDWTVLFIDDGSTDSTASLLASFYQADIRFKSILLARNFGHQIAVSAGIGHVDVAADLVFILDADLQDPPELLVDCVALWREGADVVYAVRQERKEGWLLRSAYATFYRIMRAMSSIEIPLDSGDFCLMDKKVVDVLRALPEQNPFIRGMRAWAGFNQRPLAYSRAARAAGETKYPLGRLIKLAVDGVISTSAAPLRFASYLGLCVVTLSVVGTTFIVLWRVVGFEFMGHTAASLPGWTGLMSAFFLFGGVQLLVLGVTGEYIARIYEDVRGRPRWVVARTFGVDKRSEKNL